MVNRRMRAAAALQLTRRAARAHGLTVEQVPGRGKGSHSVYVVLDPSGAQVGRFALTDHPRELSWTVLRNLEAALAPLFGDRWMEKR